jgi:hypothetical protein
MLTEGQYISGPHTIYSSSSEPFLVQIHLGLTISVRCHHPLSVVFWCNRALSEAEFHFKETLLVHVQKELCKVLLAHLLVNAIQSTRMNVRMMYTFSQYIVTNIVGIWYCLGIFLLY